MEQPVKRPGRPRRTLVRLALAGVLFIALATSPLPVRAQSAADATTIFLVRHAERADDDPRDPGLTPAGQARADELARLLRDAGITAVYSTQYRRTMDTARPVAEQAGIQIESYEPSQAGMQAFIERLRAMHGRILVTGHSNTTPALVEGLGGDVVSPMTEADYDRLYIVTITADGKVISTLLHFGASSGG